MKKHILILFWGMIAMATASAQNDPNRVYSTKMTGEVIAAYEVEKTPQLLDAWAKTTDLAARRAIEVELASFTHADEPSAIRLKNLQLDTKRFSHNEIRLVHLKRDVRFYQQFGENENLADAKASIAELEQKSTTNN